MKFICENPDCPKFGIEDEYFKNIYRMVDGRLQSNNAPCPKCGQVRKEINPAANISASEKNIKVGKYSSASKEQKREILKQRSHEHFKKEVEPFKEHQLHQAVKNFKDAGKI